MDNRGRYNPFIFCTNGIQEFVPQKCFHSIKSTQEIPNGVPVDLLLS